MHTSSSHPLLSNINNPQTRNALHTVDSTAFKLLSMLRGHPSARLFFVLYFIIMHLWLFFIVLTYTPEIHWFNHGCVPYYVCLYNILGLTYTAWLVFTWFSVSFLFSIIFQCDTRCYFSRTPFSLFFCPKIIHSLQNTIMTGLDPNYVNKNKHQLM